MPGIGVWDSEPVKEVWHKMSLSSMDTKGAEMTKLKKLTSELAITLIFGANEIIKSGKGNSTIYYSAFIIDNGIIVNHHRKLMPSHTERLVHGQGDGVGLAAMEPDNGRLGTLICWEHWMPLPRQTMHDSLEQLHFAL